MPAAGGKLVWIGGLAKELKIGAASATGKNNSDLVCFSISGVLEGETFGCLITTKIGCSRGYSVYVDIVHCYKVIDTSGLSRVVLFFG